ncbi:ARP6 actin-related protein 6-like protein [Bombyx mori]|uniref:Actin-related protein 6 n=1 Tax=Bombyx mori TaxID=7091 RepID=Q1HPN6_BOMMO|nr:ARP6 actin-related protein 6-like protein [Bombyx mori]ABF51455.1 ARP6 actin-related protein 6-like protein [Bombyx mori]
MSETSCYILDNGAYTAKVGFSNSKSRIIPNCIMKAKSERRRPFIGSQLDECRDASGLFYILPFQKGFLVNWDTQKTVWDFIFSKECCPVNFNDTPLIITEPLFNFASIQEAMTEIFFEEYECQSLLRINATDLAEYNYRRTHKNDCTVVVDSGYSFTYIVPYINGKKYKDAIIRIDVGGKVLTNHLKEILSYRQLNVMDETYVINQVKEDSCFVSKDFFADMEIAKKKGPENAIVKDYVLPDYTSLRRGYLRDIVPPEEDLEQQTLRLNNERFSIPELLFHPSDVGIQQMGIPEAIMHSINSCPEEHTENLLANIVLYGGNTLFPGFRDRVYNDVRSLALDHFDVNIELPDNPITYAWEGGKYIFRDPEFYSFCMTKEEYEEEGKPLAFERFDI